MITFTIGCGVGILIGFVMFAFLSANREESLVRELVAALKAMVSANDGVAVMPTPKAKRQNLALEQAKAEIQKAEPKQP